MYYTLIPGRMLSSLSIQTSDRAVNLVSNFLLKQIHESQTLINGGAHLVAEQALVKLLRTELEFEWASAPVLALFQVHFIVRFCLYDDRLLTAVANHQRYLIEIAASGVRIRLNENNSNTNDTVVSADSRPHLELREFYRNLENLDAATEESVSGLLAGFWRKFRVSASDTGSDQESAFLVLGLNVDASWETIQARYRVLAQKHHPDRGGIEGDFIKIQAAYSLLKYKKG